MDEEAVGCHRAEIVGEKNNSSGMYPPPSGPPLANIAVDDENDRILVTNHPGLVAPISPALFFVFGVAAPGKGPQLPKPTLRRSGHSSSPLYPFDAPAGPTHSASICSNSVCVPSSSFCASATFRFHSASVRELS